VIPLLSFEEVPQGLIVPTAWHAVSVVNFAQTAAGGERILPTQGRHGKRSTTHDVCAQERDLSQGLGC
jgi:hypothetical protein